MVFNEVKEVNCKKQYPGRSALNYGDETNTEWYNWYKMVTTKYILRSVFYQQPKFSILRQNSMSVGGHNMTILL